MTWTKSCHYLFDKITDNWRFHPIRLRHIMTWTYVWMTENYGYHVIVFFLPCSCLCPIHWSQMLSREWKCSWSSACQRCSNYIFILDLTSEWSTILLPTKVQTYIRGLTVYIYRPFVTGIHRSPVDSPRKGPVLQRLNPYKKSSKPSLNPILFTCSSQHLRH